MRRFLLLGIPVLCVAATLVACTGGPDLSDDEYIAKLRKIPARAWLKTNNNPYPLASNRFGAAPSARDFVESLFTAGAVEVYVADPFEEPDRINRERGPYADTLVIALPRDLSRRKALFAIAAAEAKREGFVTPPDTGQKGILLWWD